MSVADFDGDGDLDLAAGRNWYEAPDWKKHADFRDGAETNGPEIDDNSEFAMDVNRDGWTDIVSSGWMRMKGAFWYKNPGRQVGIGRPRESTRPRTWKASFTAISTATGTTTSSAITGPLSPGQGMTWIEHIDREPWLVEHVVGTEGENHGNGMGDINGDGRTDIVTPKGWYERPRKRRKQMGFHADYWSTESGSRRPTFGLAPDAGLGRERRWAADIIVGASHEYGLAWLEQKRGARRQAIVRDALDRNRLRPIPHDGPG